jgi:hypothetical protein
MCHSSSELPATAGTRFPIARLLRQCQWGALYRFQASLPHGKHALALPGDQREVRYGANDRSRTPEALREPYALRLWESRVLRF